MDPANRAARSRFRSWPFHFRPISNLLPQWPHPQLACFRSGPGARSVNFSVFHELLRSGVRDHRIGSDRRIGEEINGAATGAAKLQADGGTDKARRQVPECRWSAKDTIRDALKK
jgi:hypothetical protein